MKAIYKEMKYQKNITKIIFSSAIFVLLSCGDRQENPNEFQDLSKNTEINLEITKDTSSNSFKEIKINFPDSWEIKNNYNGNAILGLSSLIDTNDIFRENIAIQVFNLNETFDNSIVANAMFEQATKNIDVNVEKKEKWKSDNNINYYRIVYSYGYNEMDASSVLYCNVKNKRAYVIVFTDIKETFQKNNKNYLIPIMHSIEFK